MESSLFAVDKTRQARTALPIHRLCLAVVSKLFCGIRLLLTTQARTLAVLADIYEDVARNTWGDKVAPSH